MPKLIDTGRAVETEYVELLVKQRKLQRKESTGDTICGSCRRKKRDHLPDKRCSTSSMSHYFNSVDQELATKIGIALQLFEALFELEVK